MVSAFRKDIARTIRGNLKRFVAIGVICALGVAMFCGLRASGTNLRNAADAFFDTQRLFDIQVLSTLGLDDDDVAALEEVEGVKTAEGAWSETTYTDIDGARATVEVKARSSQGLNEPFLIEGDLPDAADEVAVTQEFIDASGLEIGDTVEIAEAENEDEAVFARHPYRICGIVVDAMDVSNPELSFRSNSSADYTFITSPEAVESDTYTAVYLTVEGAAALSTYSDAYSECVRTVTDRIEDDIRADREAARTSAVKEEAQAELDDARAEYEKERADAEAELADGWAELEDAARQLGDALQEIVDGQTQINDGWTEYLDGLAEWRDGRAEADEGFAEAEAELADAQAEIDGIDAATWYVQTRSSLSSYSSISSDADSIEAIGTLFPIVFLVVAALVSLTTITRLVEEERGLIGTYKALGYRNGEIFSKYLTYALAASILGSLFGLFLGFIALPAFIFTIFDIMYLLPSYGFAFEALYGIGGTAIFVVAIGGTAYLACRSEVRRTPAELMRPKAPKSGSRIFLERIPVIWRRLSFLNKVTARNLFRYKRRFFMTVAGILGCTALIVCGFAIKDSVAELVPEQYERISHYSILTATETADHSDALRELETDGRVEEVIDIYIDSATIKFGNAEETIQLIVIPDGYAASNEFSRFVSLSSRDTQASIDLPESGAVITQNAAEVLGFDVGDTIELQDSQLEQSDLKVAHITRNYLGNYVYLTRSAYLEAFGDQASALDGNGVFQANGMLIRCRDVADAEASLTADLSDDSRFLSVTSTEELAEDFSNSFMLINAIVVIVLGMAAALAFAVLFTLSTTNISERERELATIKVLGFRPNEVHHYVNKETVILTIIGIVCGLPFGYILGDLLLHLLKMPSISFLTVVTPLSYALAAILPLVFALAVNLITNRTLNRIDMIEALKSVE